MPHPRNEKNRETIRDLQEHLRMYVYLRSGDGK